MSRLAQATDLHELARFPAAASPEAAARVSGLAPVDVGEAAEQVTKLLKSRTLVLVEGSGGLAVRYDDTGTTIADMARMLGAPVLVVVAAGLGTLNYTALTLEALATRGLSCAGVVLGSWPTDPDLAMRANLTDLRTVAARPLDGALPAGAARLAPRDFLGAARARLAPALGGTFDPAAFEQRHGLPTVREGGT